MGDDLADEPIAHFITWTTYGSWLPGDTRGWTKGGAGPQSPRPLLEQWCRDRLTADPVRLTPAQRSAVEAVCRRHCRHRGWGLHAINVRSNHAHAVVSAPDTDASVVRDQLKANATRVLRAMSENRSQRVWTRGGRCDAVYTLAELQEIVAYVIEGQDQSGGRAGG